MIDPYLVAVEGVTGTPIAIATEGFIGGAEEAPDIHGSVTVSDDAAGDVTVSHE